MRRAKVDVALESLPLIVAEARAATPQIRVLRLARPDGGPLPSWEPGAHINISLPDGDTRSYSLINLSTDPAVTTRPHAYSIGVRLEEASRGGSR